VLRVDLNQVASGINVRDRLFFKMSVGTESISDLQTLATTITSAWGTNMKVMESTNHTLTNVLITDLSGAAAPQTVGGAAQAGTNAAIVYPNGMALVIRFKINRRYRGGHPRFYLGALGGSDLLSGSAFTAAFLAAALTNWQAFVAACVLAPPANIGVLTHVNVSYFSGFTVSAPVGKRAKNLPTPRVAPVVDTVVSYSLNPLPASQRRRNHQSL
jgi:hypothetical protein